jgi:hypothetical protein
MTPAQARIGAVAAVVLGIVGVIVSKRASTDIAVAVIALAAFSYCVALQLAEMRRRRRVRAARETPWTLFTEPHPTDTRKVEVGVRRRRDDGVILDRRVLRSVNEWDSIEIAVAEQDAETKAKRWTQNKVGM